MSGGEIVAYLGPDAIDIIPSCRNYLFTSKPGQRVHAHVVRYVFVFVLMNSLTLLDAGIKFDGYYDRFDLLPRPMSTDRTAYLQDYAKVRY